MPAAQVVYKLSKNALKLIKSGKAEWTPGGIRDIHSKKIIELAKPVVSKTMNNQQAIQSLANTTKMISALSWANVVLSLVNLGVSIAGFYLTLTRMESLQGEIHQFIVRYQNDREADQLESYKAHLLKMTSQLNFLRNRYTISDYDKQMFIIRETDIENECNETASFIEKIMDQYQKHEISGELACQIIFTLAPVYAQMVNEYCCQYYFTHGIHHQQFETWKSFLDQINSEKFRIFMKREMFFSVQYVQLSPMRRREVLDIAFECVQELQDNLTLCSQAVELAPKDEIVPLDELLSIKQWNEVRGQVHSDQNETPEEYFRRQIMQVAINEDDEDVYVPLTRYA